MIIVIVIVMITFIFTFIIIIIIIRSTIPGPTATKSCKQVLSPGNLCSHSARGDVKNEQFWFHGGASSD